VLTEVRYIKWANSGGSKHKKECSEKKSEEETEQFIDGRVGKTVDV